MLKFFLWLRYIRKKTIVSLSVAAVAISCALLITVASLFTGFIRAFEQSAVDAIGDIIISPPLKVTDYTAFIESLDKLPDVAAASATLSTRGLLFLARGNVKAVTVWGIELPSWADVTTFKQSLIKQKNSPLAPSFANEIDPNYPAGFIGIGLLSEPDEKTDQYDFSQVEKMLGARVVLTTGAVSERYRPGDSNAAPSQKTPLTITKKSIPFVIKDVVFTGVYMPDKEFIYLPMDTLRRALFPGRQKTVAGQFHIRLKADADASAALTRIRLLWQDFAENNLRWSDYLIRQTSIATAKQMQSSFIADFEKQMAVLLSIFGLISLSAVLLVFCIFYMIVTTRQKDIAIIKSFGTSGLSAGLLFLGFGTFVGILGSALGAALGWLITKNINTLEHWIRIIFGLKLWKSSTYLFEKIPTQLNYTATFWIVCAGIAAAAIGAVIPACLAAKTKPVNILRYE